jgi:hypothetical protein
MKKRCIGVFRNGLIDAQSSTDDSNLEELSPVFPNPQWERPQADLKEYLLVVSRQNLPTSSALMVYACNARTTWLFLFSLKQLRFYWTVTFRIFIIINVQWAIIQSVFFKQCALQAEKSACDVVWITDVCRAPTLALL